MISRILIQIMRSGVSNTTPRNIINNKNTWMIKRRNAIFVVAFGLSVLGGSHGAVSAGAIPSLDDIAQFVDHMEDSLISHDAAAVPANLVNKNLK